MSEPSPDHVTCVSHDETCWVGVVNAPQGGLSYQHRFEGETPSEVLRSAADALDLTGAEKVMVVVERVALEDSPKIADLLVRYREAREVQEDGAVVAAALRAELAELGIDAEARR